MSLTFTINFLKLPNLMTSLTIRTLLDYTPTLYFTITRKYFMWYNESSKFVSHYSLHTSTYSCASNLMKNGHLTSGYTSDQHIIKPYSMYPLLMICTYVVKGFNHYVILRHIQMLSCCEICNYINPVNSKSTLYDTCTWFVTLDR